MKTFPLSFRLSSLVLATVLATPLAAQAQNIAIVNGKAVPKARVEALMSQALRQGNQQRTPELEQQVRDEVVLREMFMQEAEKRGLAASADYKAQMEFARQSILIRELFADYQKKNPVTDAEVQAEYDKFKSQSGGTEYRARHILVEKEDEAKALIAQIKGGQGIVHGPADQELHRQIIDALLVFRPGALGRGKPRIDDPVADRVGQGQAPVMHRGMRGILADREGQVTQDVGLQKVRGQAQIGHGFVQQGLLQTKPKRHRAAVKQAFGRSGSKCSVTANINAP